MTCRRCPVPPAAARPGPRALAGAQYLRHSTGGSLPSGSAGRLGCPSTDEQGAHLRAGVSPFPGVGTLCRGSPLTPCSHPVSWGPRSPWEEPGDGGPVPSCLEEHSRSPPAGLSLGVPRPHSGGDPLPMEQASETRQRSSENPVDCSNRERSVNISLRWFKLSHITKPSVLAGI